MFIRSHWSWVFGVAHSANREVSSAQAESGTCPSPTRLNANAKVSNRRTDLQSSTTAFRVLSKVGFHVLAVRGCETQHLSMRLKVTPRATTGSSNRCQINAILI